MFASPANAQAVAGGEPSGMAALLFQAVPIVLMLAIAYLLLIRPQAQRAKAHRALVDAVKKGDEVVTAGGLIGRVIRVADAEVEVELSPNVRVRAVKTTLAEVRLKGAPVAANDSKS